MMPPGAPTVRGEAQYFAGSTILGSGEAALILDVNNLSLSRRVRRTAERRPEEPVAVLTEPKE
jgi:chemotaxis protein histidine kinase CheA